MPRKDKWGTGQSDTDIWYPIPIIVGKSSHASALRDGISRKKWKSMQQHTATPQKQTESEFEPCQSKSHRTSHECSKSVYHHPWASWCQRRGKPARKKPCSLSVWVSMFQVFHFRFFTLPLCRIWSSATRITQFPLANHTNFESRKSQSSRFTGPVWLHRAAAAARVTSKSSALLAHSRKQITSIPVLKISSQTGTDCSTRLINKGRLRKAYNGKISRVERCENRSSIPATPESDHQDHQHPCAHWSSLPRNACKAQTTPSRNKPTWVGVASASPSTIFWPLLLRRSISRKISAPGTHVSILVAIKSQHPAFLPCTVGHSQDATASVQV